MTRARTGERAVKGTLPTGHRCPACHRRGDEWHPAEPHPGGLGEIRWAVRFEPPEPRCTRCAKTDSRDA